MIHKTKMPVLPMLLLTSAAAVGGFLVAGHLHRSAGETDVDRFWAPLLRAPEPIQICVGQPGRLYRFNGPRTDELNGYFDQEEHPTVPKVLQSRSVSFAEIVREAKHYVSLREAFCIASVAVLVQSKGKTYTLRPASATPYQDLRRSPVVTVGSYANSWTMRLTSGLRFSFVRKQANGIGFRYISDHQNPDDLRWQVVVPFAGQTPPEDYAIVTRVHDPVTEMTFVSLAGCTGYGTGAAGEFATDPSYLASAFRNAPDAWYKKNLQVVLKMKIIEGTPGPPIVVATHFW